MMSWCFNFCECFLPKMLLSWNRSWNVLKILQTFIIMGSIINPPYLITVFFFPLPYQSTSAPSSSSPTTPGDCDFSDVRARFQEPTPTLWTAEGLQRWLEDLAILGEIELIEPWKIARILPSRWFNYNNKWDLTIIDQEVGIWLKAIGDSIRKNG